MEHLEEITVGELRDALDAVDGKKETQRLLAAIAYKNGVTQTELAEWHGVQRKTIYNWLTRLDGESLERAVTDDHSPGRPRRLSEKKQNELEEILHEPPSTVGYDAPAWTPELLGEFLQDRYDVSYSRSSCRRLMKEAGLSYQKPRRTAAATDDDEKQEFRDEREQSGGRWMPR